MRFRDKTNHVVLTFIQSEHQKLSGSLQQLMYFDGFEIVFPEYISNKLFVTPFLKGY